MSTPNLRRWAAQQTCDGTNAAFTIKAADSATDYVYVTKVALAVLTHANAKLTSFIDSTPTSYFGFSDLTVAAGAHQGGTINWDFGRRGIRLAIGKSFQIHGDAAGSGSVVICTAEGYQATV
jgi:hypothetical protein